MLIALAVATAISCKKEHHSPAAPCKIIGYYDTVTNRGTYSTYYAQFNYDQDGRILSWLIGKKDSLYDGAIFNYAKNRIVVSPVRTNGPGVDSIFLDDSGLPTIMVYTDVDNQYKTHAEYFYKDSTQLDHVIDYDRDGKPVDTVTYHYTNGDCTSITYTGGYTAQLTYFADQAASNGEFNRIQSLRQYGLIIPPGKHMLKAVQAPGYWENFAYRFDNNGRIVSGEEVSTATGGIVTRRTFVYDCPQ